MSGDPGSQMPTGGIDPPYTEAEEAEQNLERLRPSPEDADAADLRMMVESESHWYDDGSSRQRRERAPFVPADGRFSDRPAWPAGTAGFTGVVKNDPRWPEPVHEEEALCILAGIAPNHTNKRVAGIFLQCLKIRAERQVKYGENWKKFGWNDSLFHMRSKLSRLFEMFWRGSEGGEEADLDDAYDEINYATFFIMNVQDDNPDGKQLT